MPFSLVRTSRGRHSGLTGFTRKTVRAFRREFERCVREKTEYRAGYRIVLPDGSIRYQYATGHPVTNDAGDLVEFIGASMDMTEHWLAATERSLAEEALRKSEERWRAVFENSAIGVALTDLSGRFLATNSAFQKMLGYTGEEIGTLTFLELTHEDYRESNWQLVTELLEGKRTQFQIEKQYRRKDGSSIWVSNNVSLVPGTKSMPRFLMALSEDITERKQTEETLRRTQAELAHVTRVASLGEMTASIAHEVNQPLAAVVANGHACLRWLSASPPNLPKAVEAAERIVKDGKDAGEVVRRVRALFKRTAIERVRLDLDEVIGEVLRLLDSYPARKHVSLDVVLDPDLPPVFADRVQLQQLVLNLMLNALEALEPVSGRVKQLSVRSTRAEGQRAVIQISDNGIGLDDSVAAFEPFVTTKPEGMGLGLAICRSIVAAHEGTLSAERNVGFGTTFTVTLPVQPDGIPMTADRPVVFVVDDDARVREALSSLLASAGLDVAVFASATEFLEADKPDAPACLVLDLELPDIHGLELQKELAEREAPPIVFITGHGDIPSSVKAMKAGAVEFLPKPFGDEELLRAIDTALVLDRAERLKRSERAALEDRYERLTPREREVLTFVVAGLANKVTAGELGTSEITIGVHRGQIMRKMGARSLAELVRFADKLGIRPHENP